LRIGKNITIPAGAQVSEEDREQLRRSMLVVAEDNKLTVVMARDPVARYRAMSEGPRLSATIPANTVFSGKITPSAFVPMFFGVQIPQLQASRSDDGIEFAVQVESRGEGGRVELRADSPISAAMEIRGIMAALQQMQEQAMRQLAQQQQAAQQGAAGAGAMGRMPGAQQPPATQPRQRTEPLVLPPPPRLQLQAPQ
jgi:hypothetical protein